MTQQQCERCGEQFAETDSRLVCDCGGLLELKHDFQADSTTLRSAFAERVTLPTDWRSSGVWRYRELVLPTIADSEIVSYPEGSTPLISNDGVSSWAGMHLEMKHEGHNPTGSFKDRGMTVGISQAKRIGASIVACASTGNTAASLAAYASLAKIPALVFVPAAHVALGKLTQAIAYGARTFLVRGDFDACLELARCAADTLGVYLLNSINPFRLEGQKTIVFELLHQLDWQAPDWIVVPGGNLGNTAAFGKALREARDVGRGLGREGVGKGLIDRVPRLAVVQAAGAAPFALAFRDNFTRRAHVVPETVASAIRIGAPASWDRAVRAVRETNGVVVAVSDDQILEAKAVADRAGIGCEPASAASLAGARQLLRDGVIRPDERVVAVLTGHLLKDPGIISTYHQLTEPRPAYANRPIEIDPNIREVERALQQG